MSLSREEITHTVQQLVGPGFKVKLSWNELDYLSKLEWPYLELGLLQAALGQFVLMGASQEKIAVWQQRIKTLSKEIEKKESQNSKLKSLQTDVNFKGLYTENKNNVVAIDKFYPNKPAILQAEQQQNAVSYLLGAIGVNGSVAGSVLQGLQVTQNGESNGNLQTERKNTRKNTLPPVIGRKFRE
jgi:hypothetical protein